MPFESSTSVVGLARWRRKVNKNTANPGITAIVKSAEKHATKWMRISAAAHLGLATSSAVSIRRAPAGAGSANNLLIATAPAELPYWMQADEALNTKQAWAQRAKLRKHPAVVAKLELWWHCALRSVQSGDAARTTIDKHSYIRLSRLLHKAMINEWDEEDAAACAEQDWATDSNGRAVIDEKRFMDCVFELADIWTRTIDPVEYAAFLQRLLDDIAHCADDGGVYFWKDERETSFGGYVADEGADEGEEADVAGDDAEGADDAGADGGAAGGGGGGRRAREEPKQKEKRAKPRKREPGEAYAKPMAPPVAKEVKEAGGGGTHRPAKPPALPAGPRESAAMPAVKDTARKSRGPPPAAPPAGPRERESALPPAPGAKRHEAKVAAGGPGGGPDADDKHREEWQYAGQGQQGYTSGLGGAADAKREAQWSISDERWKGAGIGGNNDAALVMDWGDR